MKDNKQELREKISEFLRVEFREWEDIFKYKETEKEGWNGNSLVFNIRNYLWGIDVEFDFSIDAETNELTLFTPAEFYVSIANTKYFWIQLMWERS